MKILRRIMYGVLMTFVFALPIVFSLNELFGWRGAVADKVAESLLIPFLVSVSGVMFWIYAFGDEERNCSRFALMSTGIVVLIFSLVAIPTVG